MTAEIPPKTVYVPCDSCRWIGWNVRFCPTNKTHLVRPYKKKSKVDLEQLQIARDLIADMERT